MEKLMKDILVLNEKRIGLIKKTKRYDLYTLGISNSNYRFSLQGNYYFTKMTLLDGNIMDAKEPTNERPYEFKYDTFIKQLSDNRLNVKISYFDKPNQEVVLYCKFKWYKIFFMNWARGNSWLQNANNIMWLINVMIAVFVAIIGVLNLIYKLPK